jgi:hypothetical protein
VGGQPAPTTGAAGGGWSPFTSDRPKSAVATPSASGQVGMGGGGMQSSGPGGIVSALTGGRPATSSQGMNMNPQGGGMAQPGGGAQWNSQSAAAANNNPAMAANSNTLSYGSLKNRFLSGTTKTTPTASAAPVSSSAANPNVGNQAQAGKSKLFSLAR